MESISITISVQEEANKGGLQGSALKFTYAIYWYFSMYNN